MAAPLQVIALISGGKDSLFSLLHSLANNHHIIALANLCPPTPPTSLPPESPTDLNSYMYQTVGYTLLPHYSTVLSLPLYRHPIMGSSVNTEKDYSAPSCDKENDAVSSDETEDLIPLLRKVLAAHPSANALCTGAILSTYQRTRIESVALRLHLIPLSYLWQYPSLPTPIPSASGLLRDMKAVGMEARIVKVASGGLDENMLWEDVLDEVGRGRVERAVGRFGGNVLGEGGEYETLVVDGPDGVWRGRIEIGREERRVVRGGGGEAWMNVGLGRVVEKVGNRDGVIDRWMERLRMPGLWDGRFGGLVDGVEEKGDEVEKEKEGGHAGRNECGDWAIRRSIVRSKSTLVISNMTSTDADSDAESQMTQISTDLLTLLHTHDRATNDIVFTTILLCSMSDFAKINAIYGSLFTKPNPPARVTVACGDALPTGTKAMLSIIVDLGAKENRNGLHVQSRSYWAPANIGPYSQAISVKAEEDSEASLVFIAGQIPLIPASMEVLISEGEEAAGDAMATFRQQTVLSLQHLWRIGIEREVTWWTGAVMLVVGEHDLQRKAVFAWALWKEMHEVPQIEDSASEDELDGPDAWDKKYGGRGNFSNDEVMEHRLPDFQTLIYPAGHGFVTPGFFTVQVDEIPRGCEVEWQSLGIAHGKVSMESCIIRGLDGARCSAADGSFSVTYVGVPLADTGAISYGQVIRVLQSQGRVGGEMGGSMLSVHATIYTPRPALFKDVEGQIIPCRRVWGPKGRKLAAGLALMSRR